jgi:hypothetical protein
MSIHTLNRHEQEVLRELIARAENGTLPGIYADIPIRVYHHPDCPGVSSTTIKAVLRSLDHAERRFFAGDKKHFRFGNAFHTFKLEPEKFLRTYYIKKDRKDPDPLDGRIAISWDDFEQIKAMDKRLAEHPVARELLDGAKVEHTFFSRDAETGIIKKCRADAWKGREVSDLKSTTDASRRPFIFDAAKYGYPISAAYYLETMSECLGTFLDRFNLIACEKEDPWGVQVYRIGGASLYAGEQNVRRALRAIKAAKENPKFWRGYPLGIHEVEIPDFFNAGDFE